MSTSYELVASLLKKVKRDGMTLTARCPAHDDKHNSLPVREVMTDVCHADRQRREVLRLAREAKSGGQGLRREDAIFTHRITQVGARVSELEDMGYKFRHEREPGQHFVTYFLVSEPEREKPLPTYQPKVADKRQGAFSNSPNWFEKQSGQPRPGSTPEFELTP